MRLTDMADELYTAAADLPGGVRAATAKRGGVTVTRVEIAREGLEKPRGRYVTLEVPSVSVLDERDAEVIEQAADELRALLPPEGPVLVLGRGANRRGHRRRPSGPPHHPENFCHDGCRPSAGEGHPPGGGGGPGRLGVHRSEPAAAGRCAGAGSAAHGPHLCGQPLLVGTPASGPDAAVLRHRPLPGPARQQQASGRGPSGPAGHRAGIPP